MIAFVFTFPNKKDENVLVLMWLEALPCPFYIDTGRRKWVREYSKPQSLTKAVASAIDYCIAHDILRDFLIRERKAVTMYSLYEYNKAGHMKVIREEGREEERARIISSMLSKGKTSEEIAELCDCSEDEVKAIARNNPINFR